MKRTFAWLLLLAMLAGCLAALSESDPEAERFEASVPPILLELGPSEPAEGEPEGETVEGSTDPVVPDEPVDPVEPADPVDPDDPVEPADPVEPVDPVDPVDPVEPADPVDTDDPVDPVEPADPVEPVDPVDPVDPDNPDDPVPDERRLNAEAVTLGVGEKLALQCLGTEEPPVYASSDAKIATVSASGVIKGVRKGEAEVTAALGDVTLTCHVTVAKAPASVKLSPASLTLGYDAALSLGETRALAVKLSSGSASAVTFSGYDHRVVSVSESGEVTAVGTGKTKVTARTFNGKWASVTVTVRPAPGSLSMDAGSLTLGVGADRKLAVALPKQTASAITYVSDDPACASVDADGTIHAVSEGETVVRARCFNGVEAACTVTVRPEPKAVHLSVDSLELGLWEKSAPLGAALDCGELDGGLTYASANRNIATVSRDGVVKAVKRGTTTVTARAYNGVSATVKVKVVGAPRKITLNVKKVFLDRDEGFQLAVKLPKGQASAIRYATSNADVADVDDTGMIAAVGPGECTIAARTYNGLRAACRVRVIAPVREIDMPDSFRAVRGLYLDFPIRVLDDLGMTYVGETGISIEPTGLVAFEGGRLLGIKEGTAWVTVTAGSLRRECKIEIVPYSQVYPVKSIAHRGGAGYWPENTLEAFAGCASRGADGIELDARSTKDGVQVIHHDPTFKVDGKQYTLSKLTLEKLRALKPSVCTLDEALDVIGPAGLEIHLELKDTANSAKCIEAIRRHGLEGRTIYFSSFDDRLRQAYKADPSARLGLAIRDSVDPRSKALFDRVARLHVSLIGCSMNRMTRDVADCWHQRGYTAFTWTPNTRSEVRRLCGTGVDYIMSDYPDYCAEYRWPC